MSAYNYGDCDCCNVIIGYADCTVILHTYNPKTTNKDGVYTLDYREDDVHLTICEDCLPINE